MRVHFATDHAGLEMAEYLMKCLVDHGYEVINHGPVEYDPTDDYPAFCISAAMAVREDREQGLDSLGVVLGGSGNGEQMAANKVHGIRAALVWNDETAQRAREHNDAQVAAIGGRLHSNEEALRLVKYFLTVPFTHEERHQRRIDQLREYERTGDIKGVLDQVQVRPFTTK